MIARKIKEGESAGNIIKELLGSTDDSADNSQKYIIEGNEGSEKEEKVAKFNFFASDQKMSKELESFG